MADFAADVERGREAYSAGAWSQAHRSLSAADRAAPLAPDDLERLAAAGYMLGREADYLSTLERAHRAYLALDDARAAMRCAFWIGVIQARRGEMARASGWLGRARRLLEELGGDRVERGYLLLPAVFERAASGDLTAAAAAAAHAAAIGRRFGDPDLFALAAHEQGHLLIRAGRIDEGLPLLDETMVAVTAGELSPIVAGIVYCGVLLACHDAHELRRAREWTAALSEWCARQPDLVAFTGSCLAHRAELLQLEGAWAAALLEARRAEQRCLEGGNAAASGEACYRRGEILRQLGDFGGAERAYRTASLRGREPQPGLALLRLAQGRPTAAAAAIRRAVAETAEHGRRLNLLPAHVEIMLAVGDLAAADDGASELESLADGHEQGAPAAMAAHARGAADLASGDPEAALPSLRHGLREWLRLEAPYEAARSRELIGLACRALGDDDGGALDLEAARAAYAALAARPDLARIDAVGGAARGTTHGLTERELTVLRLVAAGHTNKAIAARLVVSERTVDRHVSNLLAKLGVSSRAAATAYGYEHGLL